jgi:hypothetical protein
VPEPPVPWQTSHDRTIFAEDDVPVGYPFQLAVLDNGAYAYTDPRRTAVRLLANTETQDSSTWFAQSLSRTPPENYSASGGGFSDGARGQVQTPLGIAAIGPASVVFADAGNRRIRKISNIETRQYAEAAVPFGNYSDGTKYYRVLIISTCYAAYGVSFADSVPGRLEAQLEANRAQLGIARPVRVATVWLPTAATVRDYTRDMLSSGVADLVVWEFHDGMPNGEWSPQRYGLTSPLNGLDYWRTSMQPKIADIWKYMSAQRTPYYVLAIPTPLYFPSELAFANLAYRPLYQAKSWPEMASIYAGLFHGYSDGFIDAGPAMFAAEKQPDHRLLFLTSSDYQLSAQGQGIVAGVLYDNLARIRPWAQKH